MLSPRRATKEGKELVLSRSLCYNHQSSFTSCHNPTLRQVKLSQKTQPTALE